MTSQCYAGAYANLDVNPANMEEVVWTMCALVCLERRLVVDSCRPRATRNEFPAVAESTLEAKMRILEEWSDLFPPEIRRRIEI